MFSKIIGIDLGYGFVKAYDGQNEYIFPSTVGVGSDLRFKSLLINQRNPTDNLVITVDGKKYFVGELAKRQSQIVSRFLGKYRVEDINTKILFLAALGLFVKNDGQKFNVVTGLPVDYYQSYRDDLAELIQGTHNISFGYVNNEKEMTITVDRLQIIPQPFGTLYSQYLESDGSFRDEDAENLKIGIVDVGYKTSDFALAEGLEFVDKQSKSSEIALATANSLIAQSIQEKYKIEKENYELDEIIESGSLRVEGITNDISGFKEQAFKMVADKIATEVNSIWDKKEIDVIMLTGGGGKAIAEYFLAKFSQAVLVSNPQFANVRGYYNLASALYRSNFSGAQSKEDEE